jgi:hypothetical protein
MRRLSTGLRVRFVRSAEAQGYALVLASVDGESEDGLPTNDALDWFRELWHDPFVIAS